MMKTNTRAVAFLVGVSAIGFGGAVARSAPPAPYHVDVAQRARENTDYRRVLFTGSKSQLVLMSIPAGGDIGEETHARVEQTIVCVSGSGRLELNGVESAFLPGDVVVITPGSRHDVRNPGPTPLKLYTIYVPPNHIDRRVQATKADAQADHEDEAFGRRVE